MWQDAAVMAGTSEAARAMAPVPHALFSAYSVLAVAGLAAAACDASVGPAPARSSPTASVRATEPELDVGFADRGWGLVESRRFRLSVPLPERAAWTVDDERDSWFVAAHSASRSELRMRTWRAPRLVTPRDCQHQARLWRPDLPPVADETTFSEQQLSAPAGYVTLVHIGARALGGSIEGFALAFGASVGKCFAAAFVTHASGSSAEGIVAKRLALIVDGALARALELGISDRVPRTQLLGRNPVYVQTYNSSSALDRFEIAGSVVTR